MNFVTRSFNRPKYATLSFYIYERDKEGDKKTAYGAKTGTMGTGMLHVLVLFQRYYYKITQTRECKRDSND